MERREKTENQSKGAADCSDTSCWPCQDPIFITPSWFSAWTRSAWRRLRPEMEETTKDILYQNAHFLCEDGTSWCRTCCHHCATLRRGRFCRQIHLTRNVCVHTHCTAQDEPPNVSVCALHSIFMSSMMCV